MVKNEPTNCSGEAKVPRVKSEEGKAGTDLLDGAANLVTGGRRLQGQALKVGWFIKASN